MRIVTYESEVEMMRCMNCYQEIPDSCKFCPNCGAKQPVQKMEPVSQVKEETTDNITEDTAEVQHTVAGRCSRKCRRLKVN